MSTLSRTVPDERNIDQTLERLGGEDIIRRKYPELYKAVLNSRERAKTAPPRASENIGDIFGTEDSCKIRTLNFSPDTTLSCVSGMEMETAKPTLSMIGYVVDTDTGKKVDGFAVTENNTDTLFGKCKASSSELVKGASKRFIARTSFVVIEKDENGRSFAKTLESVMDSLKTKENEPIVKKLTVNAPIPVKHPGAAYTAVFYNRSGSNSDYEYKNVKSGNDCIDVYMPFSGSVEFNAPYAPDPKNPVVMDGENALILQIENLRNGAANFNKEYQSGIKWNVTGQTLSWEFPDNWHDILSKKKLNCANNMNFYCQMYVNTTLKIPIPIVIQSNGKEHEDPSYQKIPYINILWGCFAKDVLIRMENGRLLPIEQIKAGDKVMTKDSVVRTVTEVVTGSEEKLVHIKTAGLNRIRVSPEHPMLTTEGMMKAKDLTAGTILITEDGRESIESLYLVNYNDTVYNLVLDGEGILIANNFYAGDFAEQNRAPKVIHRLPAPQKPEEIQEELADLIKGINERQKNEL